MSVNCVLWSCDMNSTLGSVVPLAMFFISVTESITSSIDSPSSPESEAWFQHWENLKRIVKNPIFHEIIQNLDIVSAELNLSVNLEKWQMTFICLEFLVDFCRQACSPLIQLFFGFASDIDQTNINRDIRDGNWLSTLILKTALFITTHLSIFSPFFGH